jgi:hypothetical protein
VELDLHDATLETVTVDWRAGTVVFALLTAEEGRVELVVEEFSDLRVPRELDWGPSVSVLRAVVEGGTLIVEMQSGDVLVARGERIRTSP